ncbi:hypothetical protein KAFR_0E01660 [Kazachstania africana CBS 2517]|uniref:tRNA(adenine(34)) deaminase n=1 Tax=Kazachstania africana (strain ATCC 22294 / BCRC 22015 / CBS 2517 / CECT 1963 / NBRC 1671 / NRRL Y-8276) TaxID=1071382 RepID=H2AVC0_KAZAF|nr:hypothetical protein KAFR_0E01660 [Kazachstania africana CBS 2517]CCF58320.1 hypothetical protein KAFR_0E01660 [Kazachstania africana CBS 2517]
MENDANGVHFSHMRTAIKLAKYALDHGETPVACIFVHSPTNKIVAYGLNDTNNSLSGIAHAEFIGIDQIKAKFGVDRLLDVFKDLVLYVTVEPCIMCASALKQLGIQKVIFGCGNERFGGNGTILSINKDDSTRSPSGLVYESFPGIFRKEAVMLLRYFYVKENDHAPTPRNKSDRNLDTETFPDMEWSKYVERSQFAQEFGSQYLEIFDCNQDLPQFSTVDCDLIDNPCDDIINYLETQINSFHLDNIHKKIKLAK